MSPSSGRSSRAPPTSSRCPIDFLHTVTRHTADLLEATAVGLMLANPQGELHFVAASQEVAAMLELCQIQNHEGPCLDAFRSGAIVTSDNLAQETDRWPRFAPQAVVAGFGAVHAIPMRLRDSVIGALDVFTPTERHLDSSELAVVRALADVATISLLQERAIRRSALLAEQLQLALTSASSSNKPKARSPKPTAPPPTMPLRCCAHMHAGTTSRSPTSPRPASTNPHKYQN